MPKARHFHRLFLAFAAWMLALSIASVHAQKRKDEAWPLYDARMQAAEALYRHGQIGEALAMLEAVPEKQRDWPWQLLNGLMDQSWEKLAVGKEIKAMASSEVADLLVAATADNQVWLLKGLNSKNLIPKFKLDVQPIHMNISPDGKELAIAGKQGFCQIFSLPDLQLVHDYKDAFSQGVYQTAWSGNGKVFGSVSWELTGSDPPVLGFAKIFDAEQHELLAKIPLDPHPAAAIGFDTAGEKVYSATWGEKIYCHFIDGGGLLWDLDLKLDGEYAAQQALSMDQDGNWLAVAGKDNKIRYIDAQSGQLKWQVPSYLGHKEWINCLAIHPSGKMLASGADDGQVLIWNTRNGELLFKFTGHKGPVRQVSWYAGGQLLRSASEDGDLRLWDIRHPKSRSFDICKNGPWNIDISADNAAFAAACSDKIVNIWDLSSGQTRPVSLPFAANCVAISPNFSFLAAAGHDKMVHLLDLHTGHELHHLQGHDGSIYGMSFLLGGNVLATAGGQSIIIWNARMGQVIKEIKLPGQAPYTLKSEANGQALWASSSKGKLYHIAGKEWDLKDSLEIAKGARYLALSDKKLAIITENGELAVYQQNGLKKLWETKAHGKFSSGLAFHPKLPFLLSCGYDRKLKIWDAENGKLYLSLHFPEELYNVEMSPDGQWLLITQTEGRVHAWRLP